METPTYYESETENARFIAEMLHEHRVNLKVILTPVGGYPWPIFFAEEFPNAGIMSFDNNRRQIKEFETQVVDVTGRKPWHMDIGNTDALSGILNRHQVELTFMSNIPDYLEPEIAEDTAGVLAEYEIPWIMVSYMRNGSRHKGYEPEGLQSFVDTLWEEGYKIKGAIDGSGKYDISDYYLAIFE